MKRLTEVRKNIAWLVSERGIRMLVGFFVYIAVAKFLGASNLGALSLATAIVGIFSTVGSLGLNGVVVRRFAVVEPLHRGDIIGATILLQSGGALIAALCSIAVAMFYPEVQGILTLVAVLSAIPFFKALEAYKYAFEADVQAKQYVVPANLAFLVFCGVKLSLIALNAPVWTFAIATSLEVGFSAILVRARYRKLHPVAPWLVNKALMKGMFLESWPLTLSGLLAIAYLRVDQAMLGRYAEIQMVGVYSVAVKVVEVWAILPVAIAASYMPGIIKIQHINPDLYTEKMQKLYNKTAAIGVCAAAAISTVAPTLETRVMGDSYKGLGVVLAVLSWSSVFTFLAAVSGRWYINHGLQRLAILRNGIGLAIAIALHMVLIPRYGALGAAIATLAASICVGLLSDAISPKTRIAFAQKMRALSFFWLFK